ncbi:hypothetical protein BC827DRAFT_741472 [Russula dissimulans]|nr:hypothetical protein BC827DRAFT_741472 [Russula dissimulans]
MGGVGTHTGVGTCQTILSQIWVRFRKLRRRPISSDRQCWFLSWPSISLTLLFNGGVYYYFS